MAAVLLSACSNEENEPAQDNGTKYLAVNIVAAPATRAAEYEDGTTEENKVNNVLFYFFDASGNAMNVTGGGQNNYAEATPTTDTDPADENISQQLQAVVVIDTKKGDRIPQQIAAVLNPTDDMRTNMSLSQLRDKTANFSTLANGVTPQFVMCSSVYANGGSEVASTKIEAGNLHSTQEAAKNSPVNMYVERNVAKVITDFSGASKDTNGNYIVTKADGSDLTINGEVASVKVLGWLPTQTAPNSYLSKHINASWANDLFSLSEPWNNPTYYRSYWAISPNFGATPAYGYPTYAKIYAHKSNFYYCEENAAVDNNGTDPTDAQATKVIVAAQLVKESDGTAIENAAQWGGMFDGEDAVKTSMASFLHIKDASDNAIAADDIVFKTAASVGELTNLYYVYAQLSTAGEAKTWKDADTGNSLTKDEVNTRLKDMGPVKIWKGGYCYYYATIKHLNSGATGMGKVGVVRNHLYKISITGFVGMGTPVYTNPTDPSDPETGTSIIPETPADTETYIAAKISILSWRVVPSSITLGK